MKINWNRKYTTIAAYAVGVIVVAVLFWKFVNGFDEIIKGFSWVGQVAAPVICGIVIAYILNPLMVYFENKIFGSFKEHRPPRRGLVVRKLRSSRVGDTAVVKEIAKHEAPVETKIRRRKTVARVISMILTFLIVLGVITGIIWAVGPSVAKSVVDLAERMPDYVRQIESWVNKIFEDNPDIAQYISKEVTNFSELVSKIAESIQPVAGDIIGNVSSGLMKFIGAFLVALKNVIIGFIIAIYLLYSKERLLAQAKKILIAFVRKDHCRAIFSGLAKSNDIFKKYIISNILDSMIIFVFMLIGMFAMGMPYATLISVVCAVTNLVPFFGPFLGAIPCGLFILLDAPVKVIWFGIFVLVIQQIDGNVIKPFLFGETMGLPAIWVLVSIIVGGGMFGIPGMLLGAPVFAVFYLLFAEFVTSRLKRKNLPGETEAYVDSFSKFEEEHFKSPPPKEEAATPAKSAPANTVQNKSPQKPNSKPQGKQNNFHKK